MFFNNLQIQRGVPYRRTTNMCRGHNLKRTLLYYDHDEDLSQKHTLIQGIVSKGLRVLMRSRYVLHILRYFSWQDNRKKTNADIIILNLRIQFCCSVNTNPQVGKLYVKTIKSDPGLGTHSRKKVPCSAAHDAYRYRGVHPPGFYYSFDSKS